VRKLLPFVLIAVMAIYGASANAIDYWGGPPTGAWDRGGNGTTFEHWDYSTADLFPATFDNLYGLPVMGQPDPGDWEYGSWVCPPELDPSGVVSGWHCLSLEGGTLTFTIPNTPIADGTKWIFLQITCTEMPQQASVAATGMTGSGSWDTLLPMIAWPGSAPYGGSWYTYNFGLFVRPNPTSETITIEVPFNTVIDQVVMDTLCSPGPIQAEDGRWGDFKLRFK
jgi:hypothetical protein